MRDIWKDKLVFRRLLIPVFIVLVLLLLGMQGWHLFSSRLVDVELLKKGVSSQEIPAGALLAKEEVPLKAPVEGEVKMLLKDGERLKSGAVLAKITGINNSVTVYSPRAGVLCTHVDGLEGALKPENINVLDIQTIEKIDISDKTQLKNSKVEKGVPFCKLVDNLNPLFMFLQFGDKTNDVDLDERHGFDILWQEKRMYGRILERRDQTETGFWVEISNYPEELLHLRQIDVQIIIKELHGYPVPYDALVFHENQAGIYIIKNGFVRWTPVEIAGRVNDKVVLKEDGLGVNIRCVINPDSVKEGTRVE